MENQKTKKEHAVVRISFRFSLRPWFLPPISSSSAVRSSPKLPKKNQITVKANVMFRTIILYSSLSPSGLLR